MISVSESKVTMEAMRASRRKPESTPSAVNFVKFGLAATAASKNSRAASLVTIDSTVLSKPPMTRTEERRPPPSAAPAFLAASASSSSSVSSSFESRPSSSISLALPSLDSMFFSSITSSTCPAGTILTLSSVFLYFWNFFLKGFLPVSNSISVTPSDHL